MKPLISFVGVRTVGVCRQRPLRVLFKRAVGAKPNLHFLRPSLVVILRSEAVGRIVRAWRSIAIVEPGLGANDGAVVVVCHHRAKSEDTVTFRIAPDLITVASLIVEKMKAIVEMAVAAPISCFKDDATGLVADLFQA